MLKKKDSFKTLIKNKYLSTILILRFNNNNLILIIIQTFIVKNNFCFAFST